MARRPTRPGGAQEDYSDGSPYRDYNDRHYTDHYRDNDYDDYQDSDDFRRSDQRVADPPRNQDDELQKVIHLGADGSWFLEGDPDALSALFSDSLKNEVGKPIDVLPRLLNAGWKVHSIAPGLTDNEKLVVLRTTRLKGRR